MSPSENKRTTWSMGTALGAAVAASACCTIPLALVSLGIGGAWVGTLTVLEPYRWIFIALAIGALGYAGYNEWQMSRPDCSCETSLSPVVRRSLLGAGALAVLALVVTPWLIASSPTAATDQAVQATTATSPQEPATPTSFQQVVLDVEGMTCSTCPVTVRKALEGVEGVYRAEVTYEPPQAIVRFDPARVSVEDLTNATKDAGYPSHSQTTP